MFIGCKHTTKIPIDFTKFNKNSMEANIQQNFYNKVAIAVVSSKLSSGAYTFKIWCKNHEMAHNNPLLPVNVVYSLHTVAYQLGTFSSLDLLGTCVQDMKSCPTHAVESSKINKGFGTASSQLQTRQPSLYHMCLIGFKSGNKLHCGRLALLC